MKTRANQQTIERWKRMVELRKAGLTYKEIAEVLELKVNYVEHHIGRAFKYVETEKMRNG